MGKNEDIKKEELENEAVEEQDSNEEEIKEENEIEELTNRLLRLQADFMNYKNRVDKDKENLYTYATEDIVTQLLPVLDNFERALDNIDEKDKVYEGVKMIYDQILDVLSKNGLKEIQSVGESFDPNFHHAVFTEEVEDKEEDIILEVLQKGYMLKDKVIRPSMVKVAK